MPHMCSLSITFVYTLSISVLVVPHILVGSAVQFQKEYSSSMIFKNGTPQGSCLSPILFSYVMNRLLNLKLPTYADDLALSCCHPDKCKVIKIQDTRYKILYFRHEAHS